MKLTLILLIAFVLHAGARGTAQTVTLSVKDMPLEKVCKEIERQTGYYFVYAKELGQSAYIVNVNFHHVNLYEALHEIFAKSSFTYQIIDKVVVVNTLNKSTTEYASSSERMIKVEGVVLSDQGQPLSGSSITIKATGRGTFTNEKGEFLLPSIPFNSELIISHVGYHTQIVLPKEGKYLEVRMGPAINVLDATVVKGYYITSNRLNTGNVTTVKGDDIVKQPITDPILALEGRVPGLSISQTSGVPGAYSKIQLRGQNTFSSGKPVTANDPLYIVDGIPFSSQSLTSEFIGGGIFQAPTTNNGPGQGMSPFNNLNPADIESVEILKDADATAIYGSRGANGVILITTKKGRPGQSRVDINVYTGASRITRELNLLSTKQYLEMRREAISNDGLTEYLVPEFASAFPDILIWDTTRYTDWQKVLINNNTARFTNAQINLSGGNTNTQFIISGGYSRQGTLFPGNYTDRKASLHAVITQASFNQRFHTQLSINYGNDNSNLPNQDLTQYIILPPDAPALYDANGNLNWMTYQSTATWNNPLAYTAARSKALAEYMAGNLVLSYNIVNGLEFKCNIGYSQQRMNQTILTPSDYYKPPLNHDPNARSSAFSTSNNQSWIIEPQVNYNRMVAKGLLELSAGSTFQENSRTSRAESGRGFSNNALISNIMAAAVKAIEGNNYSLYHYSAIFGRIGYNWSGKYIINLTGRRDGSSRFGPNKKFGNFGAVGAGWIFSKEKLIQSNISFLSFGKLRASYGVTGNDQIGDYQFLSTYSPNQYSYQNIAGLNPTILSNPYFEWERVRKLEGGLELGLLKDALFVTVSYYRNRTDNQLVGYPLPAITGFSSVQANFPALIQNTGWELTLHTKIFNTKNFTWNSYFNLSIPQNKLVKYPGIQNTPYKYLYAVGQPLSSRYLFRYIGVGPQTGIYQFLSKSVDGNPSIPDDFYISKSLSQSYFGGVQNIFSYKGFQLDILIQFIRQVGLNYLQTFPMPGTDQNQPTEILNRWQKPGDASSIQQFSMGVNFQVSQAYSNLIASDKIISDASYVRFKNVSLSYQLTPAWLKRAHFENARIYIQCQNLFTITKYKGLDPETQGLNLPPLRTITGGFQFIF